jgi:hypothetical protein
MGRRKQGAPQANLGPLEKRSEHEEDLPSADVAEESDDEGLARRQKLQDRQQQRFLQAVHDPFFDKEYLSYSPDDLKIGEIPSTSALLEPYDQDKERVAWTDGEATIAIQAGSSTHNLALPSSQLTKDLMNLWIEKKWIRLAPPQQEQPQQAVSVFLTPEAFISAPTHPEDQRHGPLQTSMLRLLRWLLPHAGLDPENDAGTDAGSAGPSHSPRHPSSPRSPRSPGGPPGAAVSFDAADLYREVKPLGNEPGTISEVPELKPSLRGYQRRAVHFMLSREMAGADVSTDRATLHTGAKRRREEVDADESKQEGGKVLLHPLWREVRCGSNGSAFYVNPYTGRLTTERFSAPTPPRGGILADEM